MLGKTDGRSAMKELCDYRGEFLPELEFGDFDRDTLAEIVKLYGKLYAALDGFWYIAVKELVGSDEALSGDIRAWDRAYKYEMAKITRLLNIQGNDITALMKAVQLTPWMQQTEFDIEFKGPDKAVLTVTRCPTLDSLEREGEGRESLVCRVAVPKLFQNYAGYFSPDIVVKGTNLPPRENKDGVCCQWEFSLESQAR